MVELYVVRHGIAVEEGLDGRDASRPLSSKGRRRFQKAAKAFGRLGRKLDLVLTSPLVRAVQTAEILAGATRHGEVAVLEELDPAVEAAELLEALAKRVGKSKTVALVGHEPQLSSVLAALSGVSQESFDLKKGAIVRLDVAALPRPDFVEPRWWLKPRAGARVKGLPLKRDGQGKEAEAPSAVRRKRKRKRPERSASRRRSSRSAKPRRSSRRKAEAEATPAETLLPPMIEGPPPEDGAPSLSGAPEDGAPQPSPSTP